MNHLSHDYVNWLNNKGINKYLETEGGQTINSLKKYLEDVINKDIYFWGIHKKINDLHIGNIKIDPINYKHGVAEYGILLGKKSEWGKGYAKEATLRIIDFCFKELNLRKITLGVVADNDRAVQLYKKIGFITEGVYKKHGIYQGKYCDVIRMALFNPEFHYDD